MKKIIRKVTVTSSKTEQEISQAVEVSMNQQELDAIGRLVLTEEQGGLFTPSTDHDIRGFKRKMDVVVRDNGRVVLVPARRKPSRAQELAKSPHGKASLMECGDVVVNFRFAASLVGKIESLLLDETASILTQVASWERN